MAQLKITSLSEEDRGALFSAICEKIAFKTELQICREVLKLPFHHSVMKTFKPTIADLFKLIEAYNIPCEVELKLTYAEMPKPEKKIRTDMDKQKDDITNPELAAIVKPQIIQFNQVKKRNINPDDLPEIEF